MVWKIFTRKWIRRQLAIRAARRQRVVRKCPLLQRDRWFSSQGSEPLELRRVMAAFTYDDSADVLTIDLNQANEQISLTSAGGGAYSFSLNGSTFSGTNTSGLTANGLGTMTITSSLALSKVMITDSTTGTSVAFSTSTGNYVDDFEITLDDGAAATSLSMPVDTTFATASLTATVGNGISVTANLLATSGSLSLTSTGGAIALAASKSITTATSGDITLSASGAITNIGSVTAITGAGNVSLIGTGAMNLPAVTAGGSLDVETSGAITQNGSVTVTGTSTFIGGSVVLGNASNAFTGAVGAQSLGAGNITLVTSGSLSLAGIQQSASKAGALNLTAGGSISQTAGTTIVTGTGPTTMTAGSGGSITVGNAGNQFNNVTATTFAASSGSLADLTVLDTSAFTIQAGLAITGNLSISAGGAITDAGSITVGGTSTFTTTAANGAITLDGTNSYTGAVSVSTHGTGNATLANVVSDLNLGTTTVGGRLVLSVGGNITDSGVVAVTGTTAITTTSNNGSVSLDTAGSKFIGAVNVTTNGSGSTTLTGLAAAIDLGTVNTNNLTISAAGAITDSGLINVTGASSLTTTALGASITLNSVGSSYAGPIKAAADGTGSIAITGFTNDIALGQMTFGTGLTVQTSGNISVVASSNITSTGNGLGSINLNSTAGNISIASALATSGGGLTLTAKTGITGTSNGTLSSVAPINTGLASGAVVLTVTGPGNISIGGYINAQGADSNMSQGGQGGAVSITTSNGTIAVMAIDTFGGDATTGAGKVNGGNGGLINIDANTGVSPTSAGTISIGGNFSTAGGTGNDGNPQGPGGNILIYDPVILTNSVTLSTGATTGNIVFDTTVDSDGASTPRALTLTAGLGSVTINGTVGDSLPLLSLTSTSTGATIRENVATVGAAGISVSVGSAGITIGGHGKTVNFNTVANGTPSLAGPVYLQSETTTVYNDLVISRGAGAVTFTKYLTGNGTPNLTIQNGSVASSSYGDVTFGGDATGLGNITMRNIDDLSASSVSGVTGTAISSFSLVYLNQGTGNASFSGSQTYSKVGGVNVTTSGAISISGAVSATNQTAPITYFAENGSLTIGSTYSSITSTNGVIELTGKGVSQGQDTAVNAGNATILVDGQKSTIVMAGTLTTTSTSNNAILIRDASTVSIRGTNVGNGQLQIGTPGISPADVTGDVTQSVQPGVGLTAKYVSANTGANITLNSQYNAIEYLRTFKLGGALTIRDESNGLIALEDLTATAITIDTNGGALNVGTNNVTSTAGSIALSGAGVTQLAGSTINSGASTTTISGRQVWYGTNGNVSLAGNVVSTNAGNAAVSIVYGAPTILGNITATSGGVFVGPGGGNEAGSVTQTAGTIVKSKYIDISVGGSVTMNNANEVEQLGRAYDVYAANSFSFTNALASGLKLGTQLYTFNAWYPIALNATAGVLDLNGKNVTGQSVTLQGVGVTSTGGTINGNTGDILIDANDGAINLSGASITTASNSGTAVRLIDTAGGVVLGSISTGSVGTLVLGGSGGDILNGNITQGSGFITTGIITGNAGGAVILDKSANTVTTLSTLTAGGAITLYDSSQGLTVSGTVTNADTGLINVTTQTTLSVTGSINGSGVTLRALDLGFGDVSLAGNITGNSGNVTLVAAAKSVTQSAGIISTTGSVTCSAYQNLTLNQNNNLGSVKVGNGSSNVYVKDVSGDLDIAGINGGSVIDPGIPTRDGFAFAGWNTAANGSGTAITFP